MIVELETLKNVIEELDLCFLSQDEVKGFSEKMLSLLKSSDEKKKSSSNIFQEVDEEEKEIIGEEIKQEEEVQVAISELIGILFKTHKEMTIELAKYLINNILPSAFQQGQSEVMNKFGIFLIDDMIEYLGYEVLSAEWL
jgi:importin-5